MTIRFFLHDEPDGSGRHRIKCQYSHASKRWRFSTKAKCPKRDWSNAKQRLKPKAPLASQINLLLDKVERDVLEIAYGIELRDEHPTTDAVKAELIKQRSRGEGAQFWDVWDSFMRDYVGRMAKNTQTRYKTLEKRLREYEIREGTELSFRDMTGGWNNRFCDFLRQAHGNDLNTQARRMKEVKKFLRWSVRGDYWDGGNKKWEDWEANFKDSGFKPIYLDDYDLERLEQYNFGENQRLRKIADLFLFMADTGLRFGDTQNLSFANERNGVLFFRNQKGDRMHEVQMSTRAQRIFRQGLHRISNQKFNKGIKEAARIAGLTEEVWQGKTLVVKCSAITAHTARRSFATRLLNKGVPLGLVQRMMDHTTAQITERYDRSGLSEQHEAIKKALG